MFVIVGALLICVLLVCFATGALFIFGVMTVGTVGTVNGMRKQAVATQAADAAFLEANGCTREEFVRDRAQILGMSVRAMKQLNSARALLLLNEQLRVRGASDIQARHTHAREVHDYLLGRSHLPTDRELVHRIDRAFLAFNGCTQAQENTLHAAKAKMTEEAWAALTGEVRQSVRARLFSADIPVVFEEADAQFERVSLRGVLTKSEWHKLPSETRTARAEEYLAAHASVDG